MFNKGAKWEFKMFLVAAFIGATGVALGNWAEIAAEHGADFHAEVPNQDWQNQQEAQDESKGGDVTTYTDSNGCVHVYENGNEDC